MDSQGGHMSEFPYPNLNFLTLIISSASYTLLVLKFTFGLSSLSSYEM